MDQEEYNKRIVPMENWVFRIAYHFLRSKEEAKDKKQDVFERCWIARSDLDRCYSVESYVNKTTQFFCIDFLRKEKRRKNAIRNLANDQETEVGPVNTYDRKYIFKRVTEVAELLPPDKRDTFLMRDVEGMEYQEIADQYGMDISWVYNTISRARKQLLEDVIKLNLHELYRN